MPSAGRVCGRDTSWHARFAETFPPQLAQSGSSREFGTRHLLIDDYVAASGTKLQTRGDDPDVLLCLLFSHT
jgi:hypothetical protein